jgi:hypothetical protein
METKLKAVAVAAMTAITASAQASLVLLGPQDFQGTGLGAVNTILTMTSPGSTSNESASVGLDLTGAQAISGDALRGSSQTQVRSISSLGLTSASALRVVFNAIEPGNAQNSINLDNLVLNIYSPTGSVLFTSGAFSAQGFPNTFTGAGNSGFVFGLDRTQADAAQAAAFSGGSFGSNLIGLSASASSATGGPETFFVAAAPTVSTGAVPPVPEPQTYAMLMAGLALLAFISRRRA